MVAVAVLLWAGLMACRSIYYEVLARSWLAPREQAYLDDTLALERRTGKPLTPREVHLVEFGHRMVAYIARQRARYEFIAHHPWLPVAADPPLPEWHEP